MTTRLVYFKDRYSGLYNPLYLNFHLAELKARGGVSPMIGSPDWNWPWRWSPKLKDSVSRLFIKIRCEFFDHGCGFYDLLRIDLCFYTAFSFHPVNYNNINDNSVFFLYTTKTILPHFVPKFPTKTTVWLLELLQPSQPLRESRLQLCLCHPNFLLHMFQ